MWGLGFWHVSDRTIAFVGCLCHCQATIRGAHRPLSGLSKHAHAHTGLCGHKPQHSATGDQMQVPNRAMCYEKTS